MAVRSVGRAGRRIVQSYTHFDHSNRLLWSLLRGRETTFHTKSGLRVHVPNVPGARFPVYEINADDVYRLGELLADLPESFVVADIGAHVGSFSLAVCAAAPKATVHAYEASPSTAAWLTRNVAANDLQERLIAYQSAVNGDRGTLTFRDNGEASAHTGLTAPDDLGATVTVTAVSFADVVAAAGGRVDVVKLDAEGAEYRIILDSDPGLWRPVQRVVMEYHPVPDHTLADLVAYFAAVGLDLVRDEPADRAGLGNAWFTRTADAAA